MIRSLTYATEGVIPLTLEWANPQQAANGLAAFFTGPFDYYMSTDFITGDHWATVACQSAGRVSAMFCCDEPTAAQIVNLANGE